MTGRRILVALVVAAVGVAFADSSIVVLALPELYTRFDTTIERVSWVVTAYNAAVAAAALVLIAVVHRVSAKTVFVAGLLVFTAASIACAAAGSLWFLVGARAVQGVGAALLLAGSLPLIVSLTGSALRGATVWTLAGTLAAALGPALRGGGTQALGWRAIFVVQAPLAPCRLLAPVGGHTPPLPSAWMPRGCWRKPGAVPRRAGFRRTHVSRCSSARSSACSSCRSCS